MHSRPGLPDGPYLVVGLARSGAAIARVLVGHGEVIGCDSGDPDQAAGLEGVEVHLASDGLELLDRARTLVKSPGVPWEVPVVEKAVARGLEVTGEMELAWRLLSNPFLAVTGTNGKTTTVELLGEMYRQAGLPVAVAGNVGTPLATLVGTVDPEAVVVCESSSFQLEDSSAFAPDCAILLNIQEDHLDRHGDLERYRQAKMKIFANQCNGDVAIDPDVVAAHTEVENGVLSVRGKVLLPLSEVRLRGAHNLENARAAALAATDMKVPAEAIRQAIRSFAGVPHRMEEVTSVDGVLYVNDSKATNVASAAKAIESFETGVHAILGGSLKGGGFAGLREPLRTHARAAYLIGDAQEGLEADLDGTVTLRRCGTLEEAVREAAETARSGEVVLLSPACASFDAFQSYEHRGERFRALATSLR